MGALADTALAHEFPVLDREGLVYLDSSATSQTPRAVIEAMDDYYEAHRASVHRGVYPLQVEATEMFEGRIVKEGGPELVEQLERQGYGWVRDEVAAAA